MRLIRLVLVEFDTPLKLPGMLSATVGPVAVETHVTTFNGQPNSRLLTFASIEIESDPTLLDEDHYLIVPDAQRKACEFAIEFVFNTLSVLNRTRRVIASASPPVAFAELSDSQKTTLGQCKGLGKGPQMQFLGYSSADLTNPKYGLALRDRVHALALMAEEQSTNHPVGKYRELVRFFENAFALSATQLDKKLAQFLSGAELGYSRTEVKEWLSHRHGSMHGDQKETSKLVMESDVRQFLPRMEQAAYDVLFNKKLWHSSSTERRTILHHDVATVDSNGKR